MGVRGAVADDSVAGGRDDAPRARYYGAQDFIAGCAQVQYGIQLAADAGGTIAGLAHEIANVPPTGSGSGPYERQRLDHEIGAAGYSGWDDSRSIRAYRLPIAFA